MPWVGPLSQPDVMHTLNITNRLSRDAAGGLDYDLQLMYLHGAAINIEHMPDDTPYMFTVKNDGREQNLTRVPKVEGYALLASLLSRDDLDEVIELVRIDLVPHLYTRGISRFDIYEALISALAVKAMEAF